MWIAFYVGLLAAAIIGVAIWKARNRFPPNYDADFETNGPFCCHRCNHALFKNSRVHNSTVILCPECRNEFCPTASDHTQYCTFSNERNQPGSVFQDDPTKLPEWLMESEQRDAELEL